MNKLLIGLLGFAVVLGAGALVLQREATGELRAEVAALRDEVQQLARQRAAAAREEVKAASVATTTPESSRADEARTELARLREELNALKKTTQEVALQAQAATQAARGESPIPLKLTPAGELKNAGRATASAAVETLLWAAVGGDVEAVMSSILLDPSAQAKAEELFARLPESARTQYGSPDKLVALMIAKDAASVTGMQILGQRDISPDVVGVRVRLANEEGKTKEQGLAFQKTADGLRARIPDDVVDKYVKQLGGK